MNTFRQLGYAIGIAAFGALVTARMEHSLTGTAPDPHTAAHALAGGAARELGALPSGALHSAFASGLNAAALTAGVLGLLAGAAVLASVRVRAPRTVSAAPEPAHR